MSIPTPEASFDLIVGAALHRLAPGHKHRPMLFTRRKAVDEANDDTRRLQREREVLLGKLQQTLVADARFKVTTVDGLNWICPYTLRLLPTPFGYAEPAREYLFAERPWTTAKLRPLDELLRQRWLLHLQAVAGQEPRLRVFAADGRWLEPYSGEWVALPRPGRVLGPDLLAQMADVLARSPQARAGRLLSPASIEALRRKHAAPDSTASSAPAPATDAAPAGKPQASSGLRAIRRSTADATPPSQRPSQRRAAITGKAASEWDRAQQILGKLLAPMPALPGWHSAVHCLPHEQVGGDLYEFQRLGDGRLFLAIGDVSGHGMQGAVVVVAALKALRRILAEDQHLPRLLVRLNDDLRRALMPGQFLTLTVAILDPATGVLHTCSAGHHAGVLVSPTRAALVERIGARGPALGLLPGERIAPSLKPVTAQLAPGDTLLLYTDGLTEARNAQGDEYGELRLVGTLLSQCHRPCADLAARLIAGVRAHVDGPIADDASVLILRRDGGEET